MPEPGAHVGDARRYELLRHRDSGAMGDVWEAFDNNLDRLVAVKFPLHRPRGINPNREREAADRALFDREALTMAQVSSPYVATIHDRHMGAEPFLVMELVEGRPLSRLLGETPLPLERTCRWSSQIAEGLGAAHEVGVVHRDIKPGNILITDDRSDVRIIDFGLARFADATASYSGAGTPLYTSPEQCRMEAGDRRSDLYSLGCVMYEMVTGWTPFGDRSSDPGALARAHQERLPVSPRVQVAGVPEPLDRLIMSLLAKSPDERPQNAQAVIHAVREVERAPVMPEESPSRDHRSVRGAASPHVNTGFVARIRETERRARKLRIRYGHSHPEAIAARMELAELTGRSGDALGAAQLYDGLGQDCRRWFGPHDRRTLDAFEGIARWIEGATE
ncbi:serine/threonine-protein kinase [Streptomyces arboris]|uniref:serine/threonine-protein kinase n=1 Tax=Streptomyces arboris TaxID=2600619 RepID=UPI0036284C32